MVQSMGKNRTTTLKAQFFDRRIFIIAACIVLLASPCKAVAKTKIRNDCCQLSLRSLIRVLLLFYIEKLVV